MHYKQLLIESSCAYSVCGCFVLGALRPICDESNFSFTAHLHWEPKYCIKLWFESSPYFWIWLGSGFKNLHTNTELNIWGYKSSKDRYSNWTKAKHKTKIMRVYSFMQFNQTHISCTTDNVDLNFIKSELQQHAIKCQYFQVAPQFNSFFYFGILFSISLKISPDFQQCTYMLDSFLSSQFYVSSSSLRTNSPMSAWWKTTIVIGSARRQSVVAFAATPKPWPAKQNMQHRRGQ